MREQLESTILHRKVLALLSICLLVLVVIISNAFRLQIVEGQANLRLAAATNRTREVIRAPRGLLYDTNGVRLVNNDPAFNVYVVPSELKKNTASEFTETAAELSKLFNTDQQNIQKRYETSAFTSEGKLVAERVTLIYNITYEQFLANFDTLKNMPGVYISTDTKRSYISEPSLTHLLGYVGDINAEEFKKLQERVSGFNDNRASIGKDGLEKVYDIQLRGEDGLQISERVATEEEKRSWIPKSYRAGDNLYLTIDLAWQKQLYSYVEKYAKEQNAMGAAAIIMEADTGKVRSLISYPSYDLNLFANGISVTDFDKLLKDDATPLLNRAIAMQIPTGSIHKIIMASALLQENVITTNSVYKSGCFELTDDYTLCEADKRNYGSLNMYQAIARSSNPYFCQATIDMARKFGSDEAAIRKLGEYFSQFNLGKKTGIDLPGEQLGTVPTPELKLRLQGEPWYLADLCNTAIGQGLVSTTPMQMAVATAAIVNGGKIYQPLMVERFEDADLQVRETEVKLSSQLQVDSNHLSAVKSGMSQAVDYGSATGLKNAPYDPIAKTGSSEGSVITNSKQFIEGAHSWLTGSFKKDGKDYVYVVALQFGGRGFRSVPVMNDFLHCLEKNFSECN